VTVRANGVAAGGHITPVVGLVMTAAAAGFFWLMGWYTNKAQKWALIVGMLLYALDGAVLLTTPVQPWLMIGFHVYALVMLARALPAITAFEAVKADAQAHGVILDQ